jgi:chaperone protein EcpD
MGSRIFSRVIGVASLIALCASLPAEAGVVIAGTRVVYSAKDREETVRLENSGSAPSLVEVWADRGDVHSTPNTADAPFVLTPPIFRVEPHKGQTLRMMYTGENLPGDKESLFWLNVLDIPSKSKDSAGKNMLQVAFRTRIKIFFRPAGLDAQGALNAENHVAWKVVPALAGKGGYTLQGSNASPYYVNVSAIDVELNGKNYHVTHGAMIDPHGEATFAFDEQLPQLPPGTKLQYSTVGDLGGEVKTDGTVAQ